MERVSHRPENLLLQSMSLTTRFFNPAPQHTGKGDVNNINRMWEQSNGRMKHWKPIGHMFNKDISSSSLQRSRMVEVSTMVFRVLLLAF
jgi:hypothetical protein